MNGTIIGGLLAAVLVFLSSLLVPVISSRLNKATDAAANAERSASSAEKLSGSALKIVERVEKECETCKRHLDAARSMLVSLIEVDERILPLLPTEHELTDALAATLMLARRSLWD